MAIEGPLRELGIHDVFQLLDLSRKTGVLKVTSELRRNQGTVYFDAGAVVYAEVQSNPHRLGALLVRAGKITEDDLHRALDMQARGDASRLGAILVTIGAITPKELSRQVRFQVEEVVFEVMGWREGYFSFIEGALQQLPADAGARIATEALLMEGARRIDEWSRIERKIPHVGIIPALAPAERDTQGELDLLPPEWEVLACIDGERDVRGLAHALARSEFDVAKTVFGLASAGVLVLLDRSTAHAAGAADVQAALTRGVAALRTGDLDAARASAEAAAAADAHEAGAPLLLARIHLAAGRPVEAEECLRRALRLDPLLPGAHRYMGDAMAQQGRFTDAADWWQRWIRLGDHGDAEEVDQIQEAVHAAQTLHVLVRPHHGR